MLDYKKNDGTIPAGPFSIQFNSASTYWVPLCSCPELVCLREWPWGEMNRIHLKGRHAKGEVSLQSLKLWPTDDGPCIRGPLTIYMQFFLKNSQSSSSKTLVWTSRHQEPVPFNLHQADPFWIFCKVEMIWLEQGLSKMKAGARMESGLDEKKMQR